MLAAIPRLTLALLFYHEPIGLDDMFQYDMLARSLVSGKGYRWYQRADVQEHYGYFHKYYGIDVPIEDVPENGYRTTFRAPGYPLFLASVYTAAEPSIRIGVTRMVQALIGASTAILTASLALALGFGRKTALWAGIAIAFYPILWIYPLGLASENIFIPLILVGTLALIRAARGRSLGWIFLAGAVLGFAALVRGALVLFLPLAAVWIGKSMGKKQAVAFLALLVVFLLPWIIRNSWIWGRPTFIETTFGFNLYMGYHPEGDGGFKTSLAFQPTQFINDQVRDRWSTNQALTFIADEPGRVLELGLKRFAYFWGLEDREILYFYSNNFVGPLPAVVLLAAYAATVVPFVLLIVSTCFGIVLVANLHRGQNPFNGHMLILAHLTAGMAAYLLILAEPRFHLPLIPMLAPYAALAWTTSDLRNRLRSMTTSLKLIAVGLASMFLFVWVRDFARDFDKLQLIIGPNGNRLYLGY